RFTNAYAAAPVCSPTRASIMSGKYPATVGVTDWIGAHSKGKLIDAPYINHLPLKEKSIAQSLREGGYDTWHVGKWHLGSSDYYPEKHGFNKNIGGNHWGHPMNGFFSPYQMENIQDGPIGEYFTDRLTDESIKMIQNKGSQPFFLNFWHYAVHTPIQAPQDLIDKYKEKARIMGLENIKPFETGDPFPTDRNTNVKRRIIQSDPTYAAMIENLDDNIGRLLRSLKDS